MEVKGYKTTLLKSTQYKKLVPIALQFTNFDKDWRLKKETKVYSRFLIEKKSEFFYMHFYDYMDHEVAKEF